MSSALIARKSSLVALKRSVCIILINTRGGVKKMKNNFKENPNSRLMVKKFLGEVIERDKMTGEQVIKKKFQWEEAIEPVNLGSARNPNKKIVEIKFTVDRDKPKADHIFRGFFK